jgi:hypothetical protein
MLTEPIELVVNAVTESYSRISSTGQTSTYRGKNISGVDDAYLNVKHQAINKLGQTRHLFQGLRSTEATETVASRPIKVNITVECHEDDNAAAKELLIAQMGYLTADTNANLDAFLWGEH